VPVRIFGPTSLDTSGGVELEPTTDWIGNEAEPVAAVRSTPDASVVRAAAAVAEGRCSSLVSAGSTGATMTAALFALKRAQGVHRPALAVQIPVPGSDGPPLLFLDAGANTDVRPQHLIQFAFLGSAFSRAVLDVESPRVALLSVGEEQKKGRTDVVEAHAALSAAEGIRFIGNLEGRDLLTGDADVVVTDGFTGNVALKTIEGALRAAAGLVFGILDSTPEARAAGEVVTPMLLQGVTDYLDPDTVGGAALLGVDGVCVISHGSSSARAMVNAIGLAVECVKGGVVDHLKQAVAQREASDAR
jgi:glycerol-3-phosphate acyltransferase PlsX